MKNQKSNPNFVLVSNICFEPYLKDCLSTAFGKETNLTAIPFEDIFNTTYIDSLLQADYIIVLLNYESFFPNSIDKIRTGDLSFDAILKRIETEIKRVNVLLAQAIHTPVFWFTFEDLGVRERLFFGSIPFLDGLIEKGNEMLYSQKIDNCQLIDLKYLISQIGIDHSYNLKGRFRWNVLYSKELIAKMVSSIEFQIKKTYGETKKCLVVDCDNVLWGGIVSEQGIEGIYLNNIGIGREYYELQLIIKLLYDYGVILAICSKNEKDDVMQVFRKHSAMVLSENHISCFCVNWYEKSENIKRISNIINIGLDSVVFLDDSEYEIKRIKAVLPDVTTILYNRETVLFDLASCFRLEKNLSLESVFARQKTYLSNRNRRELKDHCCSMEEYIESLELNIDIHKADDSDLFRISNLTQRANQCTNGVRCSVSNLKKITSANGTIYAVFVKDKFSDFGLVGAMGVEGNCLSLFVLSCRAMGRKIEERMLDFILSNQCIHKAIFRETGKNEQLRKKLFSKITICSS